MTRQVIWIVRDYKCQQSLKWWVYYHVGMREDKYRAWQYKEDKKKLRVPLPLRYHNVQTATNHERTQDSWSFFFTWGATLWWRYTRCGFTRDNPQGVNIIIFLWCSISLKMTSCVLVETSRIKTTHHTTRIQLWRTDTVITPCAANNTRASKQVFS